MDIQNIARLICGIFGIVVLTPVFIYSVFCFYCAVLSDYNFYKGMVIRGEKTEEIKDFKKQISLFFSAGYLTVMILFIFILLSVYLVLNAVRIIK